METLMGKILIALMLEMNIGALFPGYGAFRWRRFWAYFWLSVAARWILIDLGLVDADVSLVKALQHPDCFLKE